MRAGEKRKDIFLYSLEPWGDMWYSKHHYAASLAKDHNVFFVSLPDRWRLSDLFSNKATLRNVDEGLKVVEYRNRLPLRFLHKKLVDWVARSNAKKLRKIVPDGPIIHWCFHPTSIVDQPVLKMFGDKVIYHVVDPYQSDPNDSGFARRADLIVAINKWFLTYYGKLNPNCILVPHGVRREDRYHSPEQVAAFVSKWDRYVVIAAGIGNKTNYALLIEVAKRSPDINFVLVGKLFEVNPGCKSLRDVLFSMKNVIYAGVFHPSELRDVIKGALAGLVTYDFEPTLSEPVSADRTPLKVIAYLSQGCPVVSTINSYVPELDGKGFYKAEDQLHFASIISNVVTGKLGVDDHAVASYLDSVEYESLVEQILVALPHTTLDNHKITENTLVDQDAIPKDDRIIVPANSPILIVSNEEWDGPRYSKHRYAIALSRLRKVYFIDPQDHWRPTHLIHTKIHERITVEGIHVLSYRNAIPLLGGILGLMNDRIVARRIRRYLARNGTHDPIFWSFDPSRLAVPQELRALISIYHCADDHGFKWRGERLLAERCDHIFCIAYELMQRFKKLNSSVHHVPHGIAEEDRLPGPAHHVRRIADTGYGLYIGNINDRHDFILWRKLFDANPDVNWVVVGPVNVSDPVGSDLTKNNPYPNVTFVPQVSFAELRNLISNAGFGFLYMRPEQPANRISSQKAVQFIAQGKPFFCSYFSEYSTLGDVVHMTDDHESALQQFAQWRKNGESPGTVARRSEHADKITFSRLLGDLPFRFQ